MLRPDLAAFNRAQGTPKIAGKRAEFGELFGMLDDFKMVFNIDTSGSGCLSPCPNPRTGKRTMNVRSRRRDETLRRHSRWGPLRRDRSRRRSGVCRARSRESRGAIARVAGRDDAAQALERLQAGNARFVSNATKPRHWSAKVAATASGQFPFAAVLGCMDSRVPIEILFDQGIGDVFGVRVAGNIVNDDELGSLEYAVKVGAKLIVVLGHTNCGAVKGALDDVKLGNLTGLLAKIHPAVEAASCGTSKDDACVTKVAEANVFQSMKEIRDRSPYLAQYLDEGKVGLVGGMYDVATGRVTFLEK